MSVVSYTATPALKIGAILELTKARLGLLVVLTTAFGYLLGGGSIADGTLLWLMLGTLLSGAGASVFNQLIEIEYDAKMERTSERPLVTGTMSKSDSILLGLFFALSGLFILQITTNNLTCLLALASILLYVFVYTPLKRVTWLNTLVGAIPGALPPAGGWVAASGTIELGTVLLFILLVLWQHPHFYAIAWMYKDQYKKAGFKMLPVVDTESGTRTKRQSLIYSLLLLQVSVFPSLLELTGTLYFFGAFITSALFLLTVLKFCESPSHASARVVFFASLLYYPSLFLLLGIDSIVS